MREIKFRAFDSVSKSMIIDFCKLDDGRFLGYDCTNNYVGVGSDQIMQYTGLKDSKGVEIYEGDFLKLQEDYRGKGEIPCYVIFENSQWMMQGTMHYSHKDFIGNYSLDKMEVIGNIYENPNLLNP